MTDIHFLTDAEIALMPEYERAEMNRWWNSLPVEVLVELTSTQDVAERNQNYRLDYAEEPFGGVDCG